MDYPQEPHEEVTSWPRFEQYRFGVLNLREITTMNRALGAMERVASADAASELAEGMRMLRGNFWQDVKRQVQGNPDFGIESITILSSSNNDDDRTLAGEILLDYHFGLVYGSQIDDPVSEADRWRQLMADEQGAVKAWFLEAADVLAEHLEDMIRHGKAELQPFVEQLYVVLAEYSPNEDSAVSDIDNPAD